MKILRTVQELKEFRFGEQNTALRTGFVPTMGALHQGHFSLVQRARKENELCIVSIFVNPTQFNESEDYLKYPRTEEADIELLKQYQPDAVFIPEADEMYDSENSLLDFDLHGLDKVLEGEFRGGHFQGVITIVDKFFALIQPQNAYFGLKDFQQLLIIRRMAKIRYPDMNIVPCEIVREPDGLAMSSRNVRLSDSERTIALNLSQALFFMKSAWGTMPLEKLREQAIQRLNRPGISLEYLEIVNPDNLETVLDYSHKQSLACLAARIGNVRLIDNILLEAIH